MSAIRSILVAAVVSASFIGAAAARDAVFTAKLETPVAERTQIIALNTVWTCEGDTCVARPDHGANVRSCRHFARETGVRVIAYGAAGDELNPAEIARCNGETVAQQAQN